MAKNPDFKIMLAKDYDPKRVKDWSSTCLETKHDGVRVLIAVHGEQVTYYSRNGRTLDMFGHIDREAKVIERWLVRTHGVRNGIIMDGEMCSLSMKLADISGSIHRKGATVREAVFRGFLVMSSETFRRGLDDKPQKDANRLLYDAMMARNTHDITCGFPEPVSSDADVQKLYAALRKDGHEGAMVKDMSQPWIAERSWAWMKLKAEQTLDLPIVGYKEGKGKYAGNLGALFVRNGEVDTPISGMDDALRTQIWRSRKKYMGRIVEVTCQEVFKSGKLRHPRFKRLRPDKD